MKRKTLAVCVIVTALLIGIFGGGSLYLTKNMSQEANTISYTNEERLEIIDELIEKAKQEDLSQREMLAILGSWKEEEVSNAAFNDSLWSFLRFSIGLFLLLLTIHIACLGGYMWKSERV